MRWICKDKAFKIQKRMIITCINNVSEFKIICNCLTNCRIIFKERMNPNFRNINPLQEIQYHPTIILWIPIKVQLMLLQLINNNLFWLRHSQLHNHKNLILKNITPSIFLRQTPILIIIKQVILIIITMVANKQQIPKIYWHRTRLYIFWIILIAVLNLV